MAYKNCKSLELNTCIAAFKIILGDHRPSNLTVSLLYELFELHARTFHGNQNQKSDIRESGPAALHRRYFHASIW